MSSIIVLDSSDEDEAPAKRSLVKLPQNTKIVNKPKQSSVKKIQQVPINSSTYNNNNSSSSNISKKQPNIISNSLLSPSALTKTIAKPKASALPKINAAFTLNTSERHTPTPPRTKTPISAPPLPLTTTIPATITATQQRKRKTPTPPKPTATTISTGGNTMLLSSILQPNAITGASNMTNLNHLANMLPIIQSVQSMSPSVAPPMQLLATPPALATPTPIESLAAIDPLMIHNFNNKNITNSNNSIDNFKIHLPLKRPNSAVSSSSAANSPNSRNSPPTTAAALRSIKRIKPTTLLKRNDEAWQKRQQKTSTSSTSSSVAGTTHLIHDDDLIEVFPPISPTSSTATASASSSPSHAYALPITSPKLQAPQMPKLQPVHKQQHSRPLSQPVVSKVRTPPTTTVTTATNRIHTPPVKPSAVLDLTDSPEKQKLSPKTSNDISSFPPSTQEISRLPTATTSTTSSIKSNGNATSEVKSGSAEANNIGEKEKTPPREPIIPDYEELIKVCRTADPSDDMEKLINQKLIRYYYSVHPDFLRSRGFLKQLRSTIARINADPDLVYYNLKTIVEELKVRRKSSQVIVTNDETSAAATGGSTGNKHTDEQIKKLNKALYIVTKRIGQLEESEVDWDDDDSSYLQVERYKKRACQIYEKICDLTGESKNALRIVRKPIQFSGTGFPQFNRTLQAYVNQTKEFPDYHDVLRMLEHCNGLYSLGLAQFEMKRIAQDAFIKVGKLLQSRRKTDLYETVAHYTANAEDPAEKDASLSAKLSENQKKCTKISDVLEKFARDQDLTAEEIKEARLKKSTANAAESIKDGEGEEEKKDEEYDDDDEDEEEDEEEPVAAVADIEDDVERLANGDITDDDSDVDMNSETKKKISDTDIVNEISASNSKTVTRNQTIVDPAEKDCDINTKVKDIVIHTHINSNDSNSLLKANQCANATDIPNTNKTEREKTGVSVDGGGGAHKVSVSDNPLSTAKLIKTTTAQIPNGKVVPIAIVTKKPISTVITATPTAASLKIISVSSLNESVNKVNSATSVSTPASAKQRTVAEIVISDEES